MEISKIARNCMIGLFVHDKYWQDYINVLNAYGYFYTEENWKESSGGRELRIPVGDGLLRDSVVAELDALVRKSEDTHTIKKFTSVANYTYLILWK